MSALTLTTTPTEILTSIFEYPVDDLETLEHLIKVHPNLAPLANTVRQSIRRVPSGASRSRLTLSPSPEGSYAGTIRKLEEKVCGVIEDYSSLMDILNTLRTLGAFGRCWIAAQDTRTDFSYFTACPQKTTYPLYLVVQRSSLRQSWRTGEASFPMELSRWLSSIRCLPAAPVAIPSFSLRVDLSDSACLFAVGIECRAISSHMTSNEARMKMKPAWNWIYEFATADTPQFAHLKSVDVLEGLGVLDSRGRKRKGDESNFDTVVDWDPPLELKWIFEERGSKLKI
ncbi:hypothetical protein G6011_07449 [Alternaria panax]|uniref:Uncharacterized protein n=1 Tax=Alternaria panax TaxID=48097 RepID=A0AAD4I9G8_9PLEO|nr:hypothetical protein G6011_07449 [Alternaria panax]